MAAKPRPQVANDKTPFWTYPRTSLDDGICYHIRDQRKSKHADIQVLEEHPLAKSDPVFENMVFVSREPADKEGILVRDWYVPKTLVDDLLSVSKTGAGARSTLLYPVGTEAPEGDSRIDLLGHCRGEMTYTKAFVDYPVVSTEPAGTSNPSNLISLTQASGVSTFTGDEVYVDLTAISADTVIKKYVDGVATEEFTTGVHKIVRHINDVNGDAKIIHIEAPANTSTTGNSLGTGNWTGRAYTAKYILEGASDSEDAPGILKGKFLVRNFNYRLGDVSVSSQREETLGVKIVTERRSVPSTWSYDWLTSYPSASDATCSTSETYSPVSELVTQQTKQFVSGVPDSKVQGLIWNGYETVSIPKVVSKGDLLWAYAYASKGGYYAYDDDVGLEIFTSGGGGVKCPAQYQRFIIPVTDGTEVTRLISGGVVGSVRGPRGFGGHLYNPSSCTYTVAFQSWAAYAGKNVWAKARVRTWSITGSIVIRNVRFGIRTEAGDEGGEGQQNVRRLERPAGDSGITLPGRKIDGINFGGGYTPFNIRVQRGRFCHWIVDFVWVKYPKM